MPPRPPRKRRARRPSRSKRSRPLWRRNRRSRPPSSRCPRSRRESAGARVREGRDGDRRVRRARRRLLRPNRRGAEVPMKWPWVLRSHFDRLMYADAARQMQIADLTARADRMAAERDRAEAKADEWRLRAVQTAQVADQRLAELAQLRALLEQSQGFVARYFAQVESFTKVIVELKKVG